MTAPSISGAWTGRYDYANIAHGAPVSFDLVLTETGGTVRGEVIEPNSFRPEATDTLMAVIFGERSGSRISFDKTYTDFEADDHPRYEGSINGTATRISGTWHFPRSPFIRGTFLIARASSLAVRTRARASETIDA